jgi:hypothetical protein
LAVSVFFCEFELPAALPGELLDPGVATVTGTDVAAGEGSGVVAVGTGTGVLSGVVDCSTEREPFSDGSARIKAISMKAAAAPIVILARMLAVPRGPKAVLETLLEKSAPASDFPGCRRIVTTKTMHERINSPYKK